MNGSHSPHPISQRKHTVTILLLLILLLAAGLRFYRLGAQSLWNDEGSSVALAQRDLPTITRDAARDIHPPLYYWVLNGWVRLAGSSEASVRSLSALLGIFLVYLTFVLGKGTAGEWAGLLAALLAAVNPFQVYYSQEARMYMLAAVLAAGAVLALIRFSRTASWPALLLLVALETAGLYTHYAFAFVVLVLNLGYALWLLVQRRQVRLWRRLAIWTLAQVAVVVLYLPWLPTAFRQITTWPSPSQSTPWPAALAEIWRWLVLGPTVEAGQWAIPLLIAAILTAWGALALGAGWITGSPRQERWIPGFLALWLGIPVLLMLVLGLFREAYLKFLLVTAPALSLLLSCGVLGSPVPGGRATATVLRLGSWALRIALIAGALAILISSGLVLGDYYVDSSLARDNYRGIVTYIDAVGRPGDAILLNAPGQQEVLSYYYGGPLPVHPLPEGRPLDEGATASALAALAQPGSRVFAVLWATDESDPERFVEGWLDANAYKALDSWYGNVRLVVYAVPEQAPLAPDHRVDLPLRSVAGDDEILLAGYSTLNETLQAGDIAQLTLFWQAEQTPGQRYKGFVHLLDSGTQIVGQRDSEPGGGAQPTTQWAPGEMVVDNYGVPVHPATPPGEYRLEVGMYSAQTGERLVTPENENQVWLGTMTVERPATPAPEEVLGMQHRSKVSFGPIGLLGYDIHKLGYGHQPDLPLQPGDVLHANLYWLAEDQPLGDWQVALAVVDKDGTEFAAITAEPVGAYPTSAWQPDDVWRGQFNLRLPSDLPAGVYRLRIQPLGPEDAGSDQFLSEPIRVEP